MDRWIVCQIGAREHYAIARALHGRGLLQELITDAWVPGNSVLGQLSGKIGARLAGRYEPSLATAHVVHMLKPSALPHYAMRVLRPERDALMGVLKHNAEFDTFAARRLKEAVQCERWDSGPVVFSYSYAARQTFAAAKAAGLKRVLGQIDGGPAEWELVAEIAKRHGIREYTRSLPPAYWDDWRAECDLADRIVVNSGWSKELLTRAGVDAAKIAVIPLMHEVQAKQWPPKRYPDGFTADRPLRVLFLGSLIVRKGAIELLQAAAMLGDAPVEVRLAGPDPEGVGAHASQLPNVKLMGPVPRRDVEACYEQADVFAFPTHSDGFGLTQLEAQACGLPVLATRSCGEVVEHGRNGLIMEDNSPKAIAASLRYCLEHPRRLQEMSGEALKTGARFSSEAVLPSFLRL